jgi:hypothetical protein
MFGDRGNDRCDTGKDPGTVVQKLCRGCRSFMIDFDGG